MKLLKSTFLIVLLTTSALCCSAQISEEKKSTNQDEESVQVYYFHNTKRCVTCLAVENETRMVLKAFYGDKMDDGKLEYIILNIEKEDGKKMAKALKVPGQALLLVKGDKQVNLTNDGFMYANSKPEKFHELLKEQIEKLL